MASLARLRTLLFPSGEREQPLERNRLPLALCVVLLEAAKADDEFAAEEHRHILDTLCARFDLSQAEAQDLIELSAATREESANLWRFTHTINETCTPAEKERIIEEIWRVIYADGTLDGHEDYLVHKLATLLNLSHPQLIEAKMKVLREVRGE